MNILRQHYSFILVSNLILGYLFYTTQDDIASQDRGFLNYLLIGIVCLGFALSTICSLRVLRLLPRRSDSVTDMFVYLMENAWKDMKVNVSATSGSRQLQITSDKLDYAYSLKHGGFIEKGATEPITNVVRLGSVNNYIITSVYNRSVIS